MEYGSGRRLGYTSLDFFIKGNALYLIGPKLELLGVFQSQALPCDIKEFSGNLKKRGAEKMSKLEELLYLLFIIAIVVIVYISSL